MKSVPTPSTNRNPRAAKPSSTANGAPAPTCVEIQVPLGPETIRQIEAIAKLTGKSVNDVICASVSNVLFGLGKPAPTANGSPSQLPPDLETATSAACWLMDTLTTLACAPDTGSLPEARKVRMDIGLTEIHHFVERQLVSAVADVEQRRQLRAALAPSECTPARAA